MDEETGMRTLVRRNPGRECVCDDFAVPVLIPLRPKDEMGMGKTIQIISLLVSNQERPNLVIA